MGCGHSVPCPDPNLVGLWISDDTTNKSNLIANHEWEKRMTAYGCSKMKSTLYYKPCSGAALEIQASGYVNYIEMDGSWARNIYSGPITSWGPDGVWTGCCAGCKCCCCPKGCVHFDVILPSEGAPTKMNAKGEYFQSKGLEAITNR